MKYFFFFLFRGGWRSAYTLPHPISPLPLTHRLRIDIGHQLQIKQISLRQRLQRLNLRVRYALHRTRGTTAGTGAARGSSTWGGFGGLEDEVFFGYGLGLHGGYSGQDGEELVVA